MAIMEEDAAELLSECDSEVSQRPVASTHRPVAIFAGAVALMGAAALAVVAVASTYAGRDAQVDASARQLLVSSELADVVTDNVMTFGNHNSDRRPAVRAEVGEALTEADAQLRDRWPDVHTTLQSCVLKPHERDAALHSMRLLSDHRVLSISNALVEALETTAADSSSSDRRETMKRNIASNLEQHRDSLRELRAEMLPATLLGKNRGASWADGVDPEKIRWVQAMGQDEAIGKQDMAHAFTHSSARRLSRATQQSVKDHVDILLDIVSEKFDVDVAVSHMRSQRRLQDSQFPYVIGCDTSTNMYTEPCSTTYSVGMACNPTCEGYGSFFDCVMGGGSRLSLTAQCFTDGVKAMYDGTLGVAWETIKSTLGFGSTVAPTSDESASQNSTPPSSAGWR